LTQTSERRLVALRVEMLARAGVATPRSDAEALFAHATRSASSDLEEAVMTLFTRRAEREPLAYIVGAHTFCGLELMIDRRVLVPTEARTGALVEAAMDLPRAARVHEVGTGSGAVALAVKHRRPDLAVTASDISPDAVAVARENARRLRLDVTVTEADGLAPGNFDLVLANLPYTDDAQRTQTLPPEETRFQPGVALWAGDHSLAAILALIRQAPGGTLLALEHAPHHTREMHRLLEEPRTFRDARGDQRVTMGKAR
jgi:release factor glutamine methyltransferase